MYMSVFYNHIIEASSQTGLSIEAILEKIHSFGIDAVELDINQLAEPDIMYERLRNAGLIVSNICGSFDFGHNPDDIRIKEFVDMALKMHADKVMPIPGFLTGHTQEERDNERRNMLLAMKNLCEYADSRNVLVTIEDFDDSRSPIADSAGMLWFLERIPTLKVTFDTGNFMYMNESEVDAFHKLKPRIQHVHCKDRSLTGEKGEDAKASIKGVNMYASPVGYGCIRMKEIICLLKEIKYEGALTIEHFGSKNHLLYMEQSAKWLTAFNETRIGERWKKY